MTPTLAEQLERLAERVGPLTEPGRYPPNYDLALGYMASDIRMLAESASTIIAALRAGEEQGNG